MKVNNNTYTNVNLSDSFNRENISKDGFLKILVAQLQNQDPMNAQDNTQYVAQMAQFSALEQMQNLNNSMNNLLIGQRVLEANMMIGKNVTVITGEDSFITGEVSGVTTLMGAIGIIIDDKVYNTANVVEVIDSGNTKKLLQANEMIGKTAKILLKDNTYVTGIVTGAKLSGTKVNLIIDGSEYSIDNLVELSEKGSEEDVL